MLDLYSKPLRVYIVLGALAIWGTWCGFKLPISLFPISNQVRVHANVGYGSMTGQQFFDSYGSNLEYSIRQIKVDDYEVEKLTSRYEKSSVSYDILFAWGANSTQATSEVRNLLYSRLGSAEEGIRNSISVGNWGQNQGFFAVSFYSPLRSLEDVYDTLAPLLNNLGPKIKDAKDVGLYNPNQREVTIRLNPAKMAQFELTTTQVSYAVQNSTRSLQGGNIQIGEKNQSIVLPRAAESISDLENISISRAGKSGVLLKDFASVSLNLSEDNQQKFKTSGTESLILFASPREGGNIKNMSDQLMDELNRVKGQWPSDISFRVLVNPSDFINRSIEGVIREVIIAAFLAVLVLFAFIGSFRNVATAAIEIPLSLVMAFILMRLTDMNLNLISLGGLALSAGMNVDASVVVLENIFRHFHNVDPNLPKNEKAKILVGAVREVQLPIIASTLASLVVFAPLIFTKGLSNSLLADLAKAVIFSHGLSAIVALILVPTIRLQLLSNSQLKESASPIEGFLSAVERFYRHRLTQFLNSSKAQIVAVLVVTLMLTGLIQFALPRLEKEIIGKPETDWLIVGAISPQFTNPKAVEAELSKMEETLFQKLGSKINYTFMQIYGRTNGIIMVRFNDKRDVERLTPEIEQTFKNTAITNYFVSPWNPSELRIPSAPDFRLEITGTDAFARQRLASELNLALTENGITDRVTVTPTDKENSGIVLTEFGGLTSKQSVISREDLSHYLRLATTGTYTGTIHQNQQDFGVYLRIDKKQTDSTEKLQALPVGFEGKLIPVGALARFSTTQLAPMIYRENQTDLIVLEGSLDKANKGKLKESEKSLDQLLKNRLDAIEMNGTSSARVIKTIPDTELREALKQLEIAIIISILLIFITMILQLGDFVQSLLVLLAIPLGFIGVLSALWIFSSKLSLNAGLGTILLNGIAVANSIILVDFIHRKFKAGLRAHEATIEASTARLRPILMTSFTTVLGMLPIALGLGEGGKILQPLGIAVCGGLWASALMTLFFVPALQYQYLRIIEKRR